ncbi:MAG: MOSC domain-containing protein, partial [Polyangiales bacterium]
GCRGISLEAATVEARGFAHDRRFMIVDDAGRFVTQREHARLALVKTAIEGERLRVAADGHGSFAVPLEGIDGPRTAVQVWQSTVEVPSAGTEAAAFFTGFLGFSASLVFMPRDVERPVSEKYGRPGEVVSFADAFPFLLASESSLADLNARMSEALPMNRFRPNLVVSGSAPWAEDDWTELRIGAIAFRNAKPCDRCVVTTIDQATAQKGVEPLRTLATFRSRENKVYFGVNLVALGEGTLRVGVDVTAV